MSEEIFQSEIQSAVPLSCSKSQHDTALQRSGNTRILDIGEIHENPGRVGFEIGEFDRPVPHVRKDSIAG